MTKVVVEGYRLLKDCDPHEEMSVTNDDAVVVVFDDTRRYVSLFYGSSTLTPHFCQKDAQKRLEVPHRSGVKEIEETKVLVGSFLNTNNNSKLTVYKAFIDKRTVLKDERLGNIGVSTIWIETISAESFLAKHPLAKSVLNKFLAEVVKETLTEMQ